MASDSENGANKPKAGDVAPIIMNGVKDDRADSSDDIASNKLQQPEVSKIDTNIGGEESTGDKNISPQSSNDNLQKPSKEDVLPENNNNDQPEPEKLVDKSDNLEGGALTVIDGPLAKNRSEDEEGGTAHNTPSPSVNTFSHTPNSSMGSSLGELVGESAILENESLDSDEKLLDISTEKLVNKKQQVSKEEGEKDETDISDWHGGPQKPPNHAAAGPQKPPNHAAAHPHHMASKSTPDMNTMAAAAAATTSGKPPIKRGTSSPGKAAQRAIEEDDDDDDDENDNVPAHIQSKIVEKSPAERYIRFKEKLGSGAYKDVFRAYDTIEGIEVAWNVVKLGGVPKAERVRIVNEVRLLERLHHPNIISFHGSWVNRETERVIFVTEILSSGTLKSFVEKVQLIRWKIFKRWAKQILKGLEYLHSQDPPIIHRDLKCDNIFINGTSGDLRIGDFGLSTAISKKNQPLSVLGTPEFMAPELYDENYNEKVDIYAFGMLLLEIITRDVPYHECTNPAQIYKKVTSGIPPASLRRIKSDDARNFIMTCLGIGEDASSRPSATELLKHEFLTKKLDDETTIEVEPAMEDMVIEEARNSMSFSDTGSEKSDDKAGKKKKAEQANSKYASSIDGHEIPSRGAQRKDNVAGALPNNNGKATLESKEFDNTKQTDDDHFGEMPENEANMKKVTVLMGRGQELDDGEPEPPAKESEVVSLSSTPPPATIKTSTLSRNVSELETRSLASVGAPQYKVSAVPPVAQEVVDRGNKPYPDEEINLALTLPDESQTTIEFDFDLVNDDPVQVAREMIAELEEVPDNAVLDISEAISGVARQARMKQNQWTKLQQLQQSMLQQQQQQQQQQGMLSVNSQQNLQQTMPHQVPQGIMRPPVQQPQQHIYAPSAVGYQNPNGTLLQPQLGAPGSDPSQLGVGQQAQHQQVQAQQQIPQPQHQQLQQPQHNQLGQMQPPPAQGGQQAQPQQAQQSQLPPSQPQHNQIPPPPPPAHISTPQLQPPAYNVQATPQQSVSMPTSPAPAPQSTQLQIPFQRSSSFVEVGSNPAQMQAQQAPPQHLQQPNISQDMTPRQLLPPIPSVAAAQEAQVTLPQQGSALQGAPGSSSSIPHILQQHQQAQTSSLESQASMNSADESEVDTEEIRKLEQEFEKRMQRAKKSYGTRMDNLQRSKEEAEAQHQIVLEKHERERIEFDKRVRLAEEEQQKRLNQIEKEFLEKKKEARQPQMTSSTGAQAMQQQVPPSNGNTIGDVRPPLHGGHKRSSSNFEASHLPPMTAPDTQHQRNHSDSDLGLPLGEEQQQQPPHRPPNLPKARPLSTEGSTSSASTARDRSGSTSS